MKFPARFTSHLHAFAALLAIAPLGGAMAQTGTIAGKVMDAATQLPIAGVRIVLSGGAAETQSTIAGEFRLVNVRPGRVIIAAFRLGYKTSSDTITVVAG